MALADLTKQLASQALQSAMQDPAPAAPSDSPGAVMLGQISAMQKALKDDEELVIFVESAGEKIRVMEMFLPSPHLVVLTGADSNRVMTRVVSSVAALQLLVRTGRVAAGAKAVRLNLVMPKTGKS